MDDESEVELRDVASITCDSIITSILPWDERLIVGLSNRDIKVKLLFSDHLSVNYSIFTLAKPVGTAAHISCFCNFWFYFFFHYFVYNHQFFYNDILHHTS